MATPAQFIDTADGVWHSGMQCGVESIYIDCAGKCATLWLHKGHCTDMTGTVRFIERIDPRITRIYTLGGGLRDTVYSKESGEWVSERFR